MWAAIAAIFGRIVTAVLGRWIVRADAKAEHFYVRKAMDACSEAGVWRLKFAAMKKKGT